MKKKNLTKSNLTAIDSITQGNIADIKGGGKSKISWGTSVTVNREPVTVTGTVGGTK